MVAFRYRSFTFPATDGIEHRDSNPSNRLSVLLLLEAGCLQAQSVDLYSKPAERSVASG